jgi:hypothetical protein
MKMTMPWAPGADRASADGLVGAECWPGQSHATCHAAKISDHEIRVTRQLGLPPTYPPYLNLATLEHSSLNFEMPRQSLGGQPQTLRKTTTTRGRTQLTFFFKLEGATERPLLSCVRAGVPLVGFPALSSGGKLRRASHSRPNFKLQKRSWVVAFK